MIELQAHLKGLLDLNERQKKKLEDDKQAYRTAYQQTVEACAACGILQLQKETQALVDERIRLNKERQNEIGGRMKALQEQINRLNLKQQEKDRLQQETEKIRQEAHNEAMQIGRLQQGQEEVQRELQQDMQEKTATEESVYPKILWEDFRTDDSVSRNDWIERLEKDCRAIKKRKCGSSCYRAWLFYIFNKRRSLSRVDLLLKLFYLLRTFQP